MTTNVSQNVVCCWCNVLCISFADSNLRRFWWQTVVRSRVVWC